MSEIAGLKMRISRISSMTAMAALLTGLALAMPVTAAQAQLFNSTNNAGSGKTPLYNSDSNNRGGAQPLFLDNNSGNARRNNQPSFLSKPRTVNRHSNGFDRTLNNQSIEGLSEQDQRIAAAAMERLARAEAVKAQIREDTARMKAREPQYGTPGAGTREDRMFGAITEGAPDGRPQVYEHYRDAGTNGEAPDRLFNPVR